MPPGRTGVHVQAVQLRVELDQADVRMAADEQVGWCGAQLVAHVPVVARRAATDVGHPRANTVKLEPLMLGESTSHGGIINIAEDRPQRLAREPAL